MKKILLVLALLLIIPASNCFAAFSFSATPYDGGNDLRFGKVSGITKPVSKELILSITSDLGKRYQVVQMLLDPLTNDQGVVLPTANFAVYGLRGSNSFGTLSAENESVVTLNRNIVYTSNTSGSNDSFKLVYLIKPPLTVPSGNYRGRIAFVLEPIDSSQQSVKVMMNIFVEIEGGWGVDIKTSSGAKFITLDTNRPQSQTFDVNFAITRGGGQPYKILQAIEAPFEVLSGNELGLEAVSCSVIGQNQNLPLSLRQEAIYTSSSSDSVNFTVTYGLINPEMLKSGKSRTGLKYLLEDSVGQHILENFILEVEIAPVFELKVSPESGGNIEFRDVKIGQAPRHSEAVIEIKNNTGRRYQVSQQLPSGLVNKEGKAIPEKFFQMRQESLETKGSLPFLQATEIRANDTVIFVSDKEGAPDKFKVIYELTTSKDVLAGDYATRITYTISEI